MDGPAAVPGVDPSRVSTRTSSPRAWTGCAAAAACHTRRWRKRPPSCRPIRRVAAGAAGQEYGRRDRYRQTAATKGKLLTFLTVCGVARPTSLSGWLPGSGPGLPTSPAATGYGSGTPSRGGWACTRRLASREYPMTSRGVREADATMASSGCGLGWKPPPSGAGSCYWSARLRWARPGARRRQSGRCCRTGGWCTRLGRNRSLRWPRCHSRGWWCG